MYKLRRLAFSLTPGDAVVIEYAPTQPTQIDVVFGSAFTKAISKLNFLCLIYRKLIVSRLTLLDIYKRYITTITMTTVQQGDYGRDFKRMNMLRFCKGKLPAMRLLTATEDSIMNTLVLAKRRKNVKVFDEESNFVMEYFEDFTDWSRERTGPVSEWNQDTPYVSLIRQIQGGVELLEKFIKECDDVDKYNKRVTAGMCDEEGKTKTISQFVQEIMAGCF